MSEPPESGVNSTHHPIVVDESVDALKIRANTGDVRAQVELGSRYFDGSLVSKGTNEAAQWYSRAADQGNIYAMLMVGWCHERGVGVPENAREAFIWFSKAAELGNTDAILLVANRYLEGRGVERDPNRAAEYYLRAAEVGNVNAQIWIAWNHYKKPNHGDEAFRWFSRAAEQGNAHAVFMLGVCHGGGIGVPIDYEKAFNCYSNAAELGDPQGQRRLAGAYERGEGVAKSLELSAHWMKRAADQGESQAQRQMGHAAWVRRDYVEAAHYFRLAAAQRDTYATHALRIVRYMRNPVLRHTWYLHRTLGYSFLAVYALTHHPSFAFGPLIFIPVVFALALVLVLIVARTSVLSREVDEMTAHMPAPRARDIFKFLFGVPAEDGCFLVPVVWIGISPLSAFLSSTLFALAHYPQFTWRLCVPKGMLYFGLILYVLPYGLWTAMACHLLIDLLAWLLALFIGPPKGG